ncbi:MAG: hypothetical protein Q8R47_05605 [Nanoarchaeota archaeon]|nr:hypothetical protein [Nanoarchaeota archaeon]
MADEERTKPSRIPIAQYQELEAKHKKLESSIWKNRVGSGTIGAGVGAVITYLLMHSCNGNYNSKQNLPDCKSPVNFQFQICGNDKKTDAGAGGYDSGKKNSTYDNQRCSEGKTCLDSDLERKLNKCLDENAELRKRPKHCPAYTPNQCAPVKKCPEIPYIRRGD